jgi:hypothetical protein
LGPLLFLAYANDVWRNAVYTVRLCADGCTIYRKITDGGDLEMLQMNLCLLGDWAVENEIKINPGKSKAVRCMIAGVKDPLN